MVGLTVYLVRQDITVPPLDQPIVQSVLVVMIAQTQLSFRSVVLVPIVYKDRINVQLAPLESTVWPSHLFVHRVHQEMIVQTLQPPLPVKQALSVPLEM